MNDVIGYPLYIFLGTLPSLIWLNFYLRRDVKPEPKLMIVKVFFYGLLSTIPAIFIETVFFRAVGKVSFSSDTIFVLNIFLGVAFFEELLKFLVVKERVLNNPEFNEPVDAMIYMIIAALGFAAGENTLIFLPIKFNFLSQILGISLLRFLGATFLHALASGTIGFFIGLSLRPRGKKWQLIFAGLILATFLHGLYNYSIMKVEGTLKVFIVALVLIISAIFISLGFKKLKKYNSNDTN